MNGTTRAFGAAAVLFLTAGACAQVLNDGNMDALTVGNAPDDIVSNGAWAFPANYVPVVSEPFDRTTIFTVVPTSSFMPAAPGNSLRLNTPNSLTTDNFHLPNVFANPFTAGPGVVCTVTFDLWVVAGAAGGAIYVGGDNGGGGFSNATGDRTSQINFLPDNTIAWTGPTAANTPVVTGYPNNAWLNMRIVIDTDARTYDLFYGVNNGPSAQVGDNLPFRAPNPALSVAYDRFTFVQFAATSPFIDSYLDNVVVTVTAPPDCDPDFNCDGNADQDDVSCMIDVVAGNPGCECQDPDFNQDGNVDQDDVAALINVVAGGACP